MNSLPTSLAQFGPSPASAQKNDAADSEGMVGAFDLGDAPVGGADVLRGGADQAPGALLLEDVRTPPGNPGAGEHRGEHVRRHLGEVEYDGRPELDVRREHPIRVALLELRQCGVLERLGDLHARCVELLRGTTQDAGSGVLGAVHPVTEAHQPLLGVEQTLDVATRVALLSDLVQHLEHA